MRMSRLAELFQRRDPSSSKGKIEGEIADSLLEHSLKATATKKLLQTKGAQDKAQSSEILESQEQSKGHASAEKSKAKKTANDKKTNLPKEPNVKSDKSQAKSTQNKQEEGVLPQGDVKGEILKEPKSKVMDISKLSENAKNENQESVEDVLQVADSMEEKSQKSLKPQLAQEKISKNILAQALAGAEMIESSEEGKRDKKPKVSTKKSKPKIQEGIHEIKIKQEAKTEAKLESKLSLSEDSMLSIEEQEMHEEITPKMGRKKAQKNKESDNLESSKSSTQKEKHTSEVLSPQNTQRIQILYRSHLARESVRNFTQSLREEIINYKPPVTKLSIELNPQNLGALELTISKKGKDLHVQVISNPTAIGLFMQNQTDFKANLTQMGFENVDLSFSANDGGGASKREFGDQNPSSQGGEEEGNKNSLEDSQMVTQMNIVLPKYA